MPRPAWSVSRCIGSAALVTVAGVGGCAHAPSPLDQVGLAFSTLISPTGEPRGTAELWQGADNVVHVRLQLRDLTPGEHGIHFHAVAKCEGGGATAFSTAGAHYNPIGRQHGLKHQSGPHAGDAPNITVGADGRADTGFETDRVTLTDGSTSLFDADGSSIVIHAAPDDQITQPSGNSGARVACGVVRRTL